MGNCVFKFLTGGGGVTMEDMMVKVVTSSGGIMELHAPITVESITNEFPGHGLFRSHHGIFNESLLHNEELHAGEVYYLLPLKANMKNQQLFDDKDALAVAAACATPYRMLATCDAMSNDVYKQGLKHKRWSKPEVVPRYSGTGVWKVKLVISPEQLSEILSQESRTEALVESLRTVAKCGTGASPGATSDQLSVSSSWKG